MLRDVVYWSVWFSEAGFEEAVSEEELLRCCKAVVDRDPQGALEFFKGNSSLLSIGERGDRILRVLSDYGWCQWVVAMSWLNASVGVR